MGVGRHVNGEYHLVVSFVPDLTDPGDASAWRYAFQAASNLLSRATFGQLRFGSVVFDPTALATWEADVFVFTKKSSTSRSVVDTVGVPGFPMMIYRDALEWPMVIVHEFAHYALGLRDEYHEGGKGTEDEKCQNERARTCLM